MMSPAGTDSGRFRCRGTIGDDFTFARVRLAAAAFARIERGRGNAPAIFIAGDTRFFSEDFARAAAYTIQAEGVHAILADRFAPRAAVSFEIRRRHLAGGIYVTGGSRPAEQSGLKFLDRDGSADRALEREILELAESLPASLADSATVEPAGLETADPSVHYLDRLGEQVKFASIRRSGLRLIFDAMHGSAAGWLDRLVAKRGVPVEVLHGDRDVLFHGSSPSPVAAHLKSLAHAVRTGGKTLGFAISGDGTRFAMLDSEGRFLMPDQLVALLYDFLVETRGWRLDVARSVATSHFVDAVASQHSLLVVRTPCGFRHFVPVLLSERVALAGDADGRLAIRAHVPQSDAILGALLAAEMVAERGPLEAQLEALFRRVGREFWPVRRDVPLDDAGRDRLAQRLESDPGQFLERTVKRVDRMDGWEIEFEDGSWLLVRPAKGSHVEIHAEAGSQDVATRLAKEAERWTLN
jgi:phosphomannomutase